MRAAAALHDLLAPATASALTTFVSLTAIATSPWPFFVKYFCVQLVVIQALVYANAVVALPLLLSFVGPRK